MSRLASLALWAERNAAALLLVHRVLVGGLQGCDSCHLMDQHIPCGRPHVCVCVCAPHAIHYCSALPSDSLCLFLHGPVVPSNLPTLCLAVLACIEQNAGHIPRCLPSQVEDEGRSGRMKHPVLPSYQTGCSKD
uniref:Secreted protein n=1 Tax=Zonotrichia albicollis TaxID=44394 RepID=A0A8D2MJ89_ZONAL